ncbi:MAG: aminotransferase class V-fold PLP-dependent enzyme [Chitinophagaceae bacterium]|nr:aminotransferase class V-fold PLP-dependent enzyme [Chitinophagaceae bacterium]
MKKRTFLKGLAWAATGIPFSANSMEKMTQRSADIDPNLLAEDESFWAAIRKGYNLKPDYINLENGYYNFVPKVLLDKYMEHIREVNLQGSYYMRTVQFDNKKRMAEKLGTLLGCTAEELVITRNTTESLDTIIAGFPWKAGDEAVMAEQDYGAMLDMFKQVAKRHGVVNKIVSIPNHPKSDEEIVELYANAITSNTKLLMVCHMVNITGQILPIKKICEMAHSKGVDVLVDGAHAVAHIQYNIKELDCDYYGASLHKWLSVPLGAGMLFVKKEKIKKIWPLIADSPKAEDDISRLNHTGTHPVATDLTISDSIDHYNMIGAARKEARLRYLQLYWTSKVRNLPNVVLNTPAEESRSCGIANVGIKGMKPALLAETLLKKYKIFTVAIDYANVQGCRITPNLYTTTKELDVLVQALREL